ncbi:hypothetical protein CY35_13G040700 [Sphagnum magellanicum]|nr:hypothetical protein CY35_13G040700 [Sphagnum magellanicum]
MHMLCKPVFVGTILALNCLLLLLLFKPSMAQGDAAVYIVYMEKGDTNAEDLESLHLNTLASVSDSHEAAKGALVYSYKEGLNGFSAKLTPEQVSALSEKPGVLQVVPSKVVHLHKGVGGPGPRSLHVGPKAL